MNAVKNLKLIVLQHEWLHEIPHSIFHIDSEFFYTLKNLWLRPSNMIREYLDGKRKDYFSPFLYVIVWY